MRRQILIGLAVVGSVVEACFTMTAMPQQLGGRRFRPAWTFRGNSM